MATKPLSRAAEQPTFSGGRYFSDFFEGARKLQLLEFSSSSPVNVSHV
jgi:hypothetical protein